MKQIYIITLTLLFSSILTLNAQNIWGVDATIDVSNAEFQNDFIETGTPGNYSTTDWTALSIYQSNGNTTPGSAYWKRNLSGYSQGAYFSGSTPVNSDSQSNGIAIFDSDFMDNNGVEGDAAIGTGTSPIIHKGELISPRLDLTGNTDALLAVKFYSFYREYDITELSVSFSSDDGITWGNSVDYQTLQANFTEGFITVELPSNSTQGVSNLAQCRIKFTFEGDYYFAIIDDVTIINANPLSTSEFDNIERSISIYPNPSSDFIKISGILDNENYKIYDITGKNIRNAIISNNENINIQNLSNGLYFLKFDNKKTIKFIKE